MTITLPTWAPAALVLALFFVYGAYLIATDKPDASFIPLPGGRAIGGCLVILLTLGAALGFVFARVLS